MENFEKVVIMNQFNVQSISCKAFFFFFFFFDKVEFLDEMPGVVGRYIRLLREGQEPQGDQQQSPPSWLWALGNSLGFFWTLTLKT